VSPEPRKRLHPAIKLLAAAVILAVLGFLFVRSVTNTRAEPYAIQSSHLSGWTLAADNAQAAEDAAIALRPPAELPMNLFRQLFSRQMESLSTPFAPGIVLARKSELSPTATSDQLLAMARAAGVDGAKLTPRCVGYRRESARGVTRQLYFVWFSFPEYEAFRQQAASFGNTAYTPAGLSPVMLTAAEPGFEGWQPLVVDEARDCVAPIAVSAAP
jgi:hypothetical protein